MKGIPLCGECGFYDWKKHRCKRGASKETDPKARFYDDCPLPEADPVQHGRWKHIGGDEWCCTNCGEVISTEGSWDKPTYKHCHECGAKMDALTFEEAARKLGRQAAETLEKLKEEGHAKG